MFRMKRFLSVLLALLLLALPVKTAAVTDLSANYTDTSFEVVSDDNISLAASSTPVGHIDSLGTAGVSGWVWMSSSPNTSLDVHIYVTNSSGFQKIYVARANIYRQDLYNAGYGNGYHGFSCDIDWRIFLPGTYNVEVYAIGGGNPLINNPPDTYTVRSCSGTLDGLSSYSISGWAWKPDEPNLPVDVHLYIRRSNGVQVGFFAQTADNYRADLYNAGYGNGNHGYGFDMDWSQYPEERLSLYLYTVDGSGANTCFWTGYYDNRRPIKLIGMPIPEFDWDINAEPIMYESYPIFNNQTVINNCENIGCSDVDRYTRLTAWQTISCFYFSSFAAICAHGIEDAVFCYNADDECTLLSSDMLKTYPQNTLDDTECVLLLACCNGSGGASNADNLANVLHQRCGVQCVVSFQEEVGAHINESTGQVSTTSAIAIWTNTFTYKLSLGNTVQQSANYALQDVKAAFGGQEFGLGSIYIAGNANQVVKH